MAEIKFEEALKKLEKIVGELEQGELPLEDSLKRYEEGVKLAAVCTKKLESARRRIELLKKDSSGVIKTEPFENEDIDIVLEDNSKKKRSSKKSKDDEEGLF